MSLTQSFMILLSRIFIGSLFLFYVALKAMHWNLCINYFMSLGIPAPQILVMGTMALDGLGALFLILGYRTRFALWMLIISMVLSLLIFFGMWANNLVAMMQLLCNLAIIGGCFALLIVGPGAMSVDSR